LAPEPLPAALPLLLLPPHPAAARQAARAAAAIDALRIALSS
jgi:hypothetical protein